MFQRIIETENIITLCLEDRYMLVKEILPGFLKKNNKSTDIGRNNNFFLKSLSEI